jgi:hypothetical protein
MIPRSHRAPAAPLLAVLIALPGTARAEFSPLSVHPEGFGMPIAQSGTRERAMGEGGLAAVAPYGFAPLNASRTAFFERTAFMATLENDLDWLRDDDHSTRMVTGAFPTLATLFNTRNFGTFGAYYQQTHLRNFEARNPGGGGQPEQHYIAEGGMYVLGVSWGYSPVSWLALGVSQNIALGRDRFIRSADFTGIVPPEAEQLEGDTLEISHQGTYPSVSATVRTPHADFALSYTHSAKLTTERTRNTSGMLSDPLSDTTGNLPRVFAAGVGWKPANRHLLAFDFIYEDWERIGPVNPAWQAGIGYEFAGSPSPFDGVLKRTAWRAGAGHKVLYLRETPETYVTAGAGMPLGVRGHQLDVAVKYGHRTHDSNTFFQEDYVKVSASVVGVSVWGQPARRRR